MPKIEAYKGMLVVVDDWITGWTEPILRRYYWPTGVQARNYPNLVGQFALDRGEGLYRAGECTVVLEKRGRTKAIFVEEKPLKRPKWAKSYRDGEWKRW